MISYVLSHAALEKLSIYPTLGRPISHIRAGYFRFEHDSHTIYYRQAEPGIVIVRILHRRQQPENYL